MENSDFATLLHQCADKAYNFAYRLAGNDQDARDLVQEALSRAFEHRDRFDPARPFEAWLKTILHNIFLDGVRRYAHKHVVSLDAPPPLNDDGSWADIIPGKEPEPMQVMVKKEEETMVQQALNALPVHYRMAITLYDIERLSYDEIGAIMKCPIGTVCSRIHQGRTMMKKVFEKIQKGQLVKTNE